MTTTTKADIAEAVYKHVGGFSKRESAELVDATFDLLKETLAGGQKVKISGFGNFVVRFKKARIGRNPLTGEEITISSRHVATFKASPVLKTNVNVALGNTGYVASDDDDDEYDDGDDD